MLKEPVGQGLPQPLVRAYYRILSGSGDKERHDAACHLAEAILKYLAAWAIAEHLECHPDAETREASLRRLNDPSLGEWNRFLREVLGRYRNGGEELFQRFLEAYETSLREPEATLLLVNRLRDFLDGSSPLQSFRLRNLLDLLVQYRNRALAHGGILPSDHYREFGPVLESGLGALLDTTPLFRIGRLFYLERVEVTGGTARHEVLQLTGPLAIREVLDLGAGPLESGKLYVRLTDGRPTRLDPLLVYHDEDVYFCNGSQNDRTRYLSYSSGKTLEREEPGSSGDQTDPREEKSEGLRQRARPGDQRPRRLGDYEIEREIGRGGMGVVYLARQLSLNRPVALKVLPSSITRDEKQVRRFQREAEIAARVRHSNIVEVFGLGEQGGDHFYAMEYVDGRTLAEEIAENQSRRARGDPDPLTRRYVQETLRSIAEVAQALEVAHRAGLIHRDIKPQNLIRNQEGRLQILDFGLARELSGPALTMTGEFLGTPRYMSPEQAQAKRLRVDHRTDIYSLGVTLYETLTLQPVWKEETTEGVLKAILFQDPLPLRKLNPNLHRDVETIVHRAIEKDPDLRYPTAGEFAEELRLFLNHQPIRTRPPGILGRALRFSVRRRALLLAALLPVLLGSVIMVPFVVQEAKQRQAARSLAAERKREAESRAQEEEALLLNLKARARGFIESNRPLEAAECIRGIQQLGVSTEETDELREECEKLRLALRDEELERARRYEGQDELSEAYEALSKAKALEPDDPSIGNRLLEVRRRIEERDVPPEVQIILSSDAAECERGLRLLIHETSRGKLARAPLVKALQTILARPLKPELRALALMVAGKSGEPEFFSTLTHALRDENGDLVQAALLGLCSLGDPDAIPDILSIAEDQKPRAAAIARDGGTSIFLTGWTGTNSGLAFLALHALEYRDMKALALGGIPRNRSSSEALSVLLEPSYRSALEGRGRDFDLVDRENALDRDSLSTLRRGLSYLRAEPLQVFAGQNEPTWLTREVLSFLKAPSHSSYEKSELVATFLSSYLTPSTFLPMAGWLADPENQEEAKKLLDLSSHRPWRQRIIPSLETLAVLEETLGHPKPPARILVERLLPPPREANWEAVWKKEFPRGKPEYIDFRQSMRLCGRLAHLAPPEIKKAVEFIVRGKDGQLIDCGLTLAASRLPPAEAASVVSEALAAKPPSARSPLLIGLCLLDEGRALTAAREVLGQTDDHLALAASILLARHGDSSGTASLVKLLSSPGEEKESWKNRRFGSALLLSKPMSALPAGQEVADELLIEDLKRESSAPVRPWDQALQLAREGKLIPYGKEKALNGDPGPKFREEVAVITATTPSPPTRQELKVLRATNLLAGLAGIPDREDFLIEQLEDPCLRVVDLAILGLARLRSMKAYPRLCELLDGRTIMLECVLEDLVRAVASIGKDLEVCHLLDYADQFTKTSHRVFVYGVIEEISHSAAVGKTVSLLEREPDLLARSRYLNALASWGEDFTAHARAEDAELFRCHLRRSEWLEKKGDLVQAKEHLLLALNDPQGDAADKEYLRLARISRDLDDRSGCEGALDLYRTDRSSNGPSFRYYFETELLLAAGHLDEAYRRITVRWIRETAFSETPLRAPLLHIAWLAAKGEMGRAKAALDYFRPFSDWDLESAAREIPFLKEVMAR
jgi:serine/threonine protein kinase